MTISIEKNVSKVIDFKLNGVLVAVIGLSGGLDFLKSARNLTIEEIEAVEKAASKHNESQYQKLNIMKTYSIIKRFYGEEINQINVKNYETKEDATNAGNIWLIDCTVHAEIRKGRNFEVIENTQNSFKWTGIAKSN